MKEEMVLSTSSEAAQFVTNISGWVAKGGRFWGNDERMARYDGCTHRPCVDCGKPVEKITGHMKCDKCREKANVDTFEGYKKQEWDRKSPICLYDGDKYFFDEDDLLCYCDDEGVDAKSLRLVLCKPVYAHEIDYDDHYCDSLSEDSSLSDIDSELADMFDKLNEYIRKKKIILSWRPSNIAAII